MDEEIAKYRLIQRLRTRSPSSSYVSPSSNGSSTNLTSQGNAIGGEINDRRDFSSTLLQDRLREKRAETLKVQKHRRDSESTADSRGRIASSPIGSSASTKLLDHRPSTSSAASDKKGTMGVKEMEDAVDKLHKQNWDLKLDIFHRRKRQAELEERNVALEARVAELEDSLAKVAEVHSVNETLILELERRDQAVEEAVLLICEREATIERMEEEKSLVQALDVDYSRNLRSSPPQLDWSHEQNGHDEPTNRNIKALKRMPSFLSDQSQSTEALRSLYRSNQVDSPDLPQLTEEADEVGSEDSDDSHSPQLSVLSESSFTSVYGRDRSALATEPAEQNNQYSTNTQAKSSPGPILPRHDREKFLSLDHVASSPIRRIEGLKYKLETTLRNSRGISISSSSIGNLDVSRKSSGSSANIKPYTNEYLNNHMPPTPDTMSTNTLRHQRYSYDTFEKSSGSDDDRNSSRSCHPAEKQVPPQSYSTESSSTVQQGNYVRSNGRPHSAEETVTHRRGIRERDTDSRADHTRMSEDMSVMADPWLASAQECGAQKLKMGVVPPRMFEFPSTDDLGDADTTTKSIVRDLIFNNDHVSRRNSRLIPPPRPIRRGSEPFISRDDEKVDAKEGPTPNRTKSKPPVTLKLTSKPPLSYSSTNNTAIGSPTTSQVSANVSRKGSLSKRSRLPGFLGGRSETLPNMSALLSESSDAKSPQASNQNKQNTKRRHNSISRLTDMRKNTPTIPVPIDHSGSATPPAIKDNRPHVTIGSRTINKGYRNIDGRPSTSGSLDSRLPLPVSSSPRYQSRDRNGGEGRFGGDGADDSDEYEAYYVLNRKSMGVISDYGSPKTDISTESKIGKLKGVVMKSFGRRG